MKRIIQLLSVVLVMQLALVLGLWLIGNDSDSSAEDGRLLALAKDQIDRLRIDGGAQGKIELRKVDGKWLLPEHFGAPADARKVDGVLTALLDLRRSWPVAETKDAGKRFKVDDGDFERRLSFRSGDQELAALLLGTSPGFRKVHARLAGEEQIFDIPFGVHQASVKAADWVDGNPLRVAADQIAAVALPDCRLLRDNGRLRLADLADDEQTNEEAARQLFDRLAGLTITDVYAKAGQPLPKPVALSIKLELKNGKSRQYDFAEGDEASHALLQVTDAPHLYQVGATLLKDLRETTRAKLAQPKETAGPPSQDQKTSAPATSQD